MECSPAVRGAAAVSLDQRETIRATRSRAAATGGDDNIHFRHTVGNLMKPNVLIVMLALFAAAAHAQTLEVVNNQPFPIAMPWKLHDGMVVVIDVAASGTQTMDLVARRGAGAGAAVKVEAVENGI